MDDVDRWGDHLRKASREAQGHPELLVLSSPIERLWARTISLVFPARCALCDRIDTPLCKSCQERLNANTSPIRIKPPPPLNGAFVSGYHDGELRRVVRTFKFSSDRYSAAALAVYLSSRLARILEHAQWKIDTLIPVPLHRERQYERGYNQSQLLALALAQRGAFDVSPDMLIRHRATRPQVGLSRADRLTNVENAFRADPTLAAGRAVLLVDDVCTTGATLAACAAALLEAGAARVYAVTVTAARGLL